MNEYISMELPELRQRLDEHQAERPTDVYSPEMKPWMKTKDQIVFAIELKEAEASQKPFYISVPPQPPDFASAHPKPEAVPAAQTSRKAQKAPATPIPQEVRHADSPGNAGAPGALPAQEEPMPQSRRGAQAPDPRTRIEHLVGRIKAASRKGEKLYWAQQEVRALCAANGLEVPPEAQKVRASKQDAPPQHLEAGAEQPAPVPPETTPMEAQERPVSPAGPAATPITEERSFSFVQRLILKRITHLNDLAPSREEWRQIARDLAVLETTAGAARLIAERHAEVA